MRAWKMGRNRRNANQNQYSNVFKLFRSFKLCKLNVQATTTAAEVVAISEHFVPNRLHRYIIHFARLREVHVVVIFRTDERQRTVVQNSKYCLVVVEPVAGTRRSMSLRTLCHCWTFSFIKVVHNVHVCYAISNFRFGEKGK